MITASVVNNLDRLQHALSRYMEASGKTVDDVLEKKGRDLGIQLYREYQSRQWGGAARGKGRNLAFAELKARTAEGEGTQVRSSLLQRYKAERRTLLQQARALRNRIGPQNKVTNRANDRAVTRNIKARVSLWQKVVGREVSLRARGIGVLAASFLWFRRRSSQAKGAYFVRNKTGRPLGRVEKGTDFLRIVADFQDSDGLHPHGLINERYGLVDRAINTVIADIESYPRLKMMEAFERAFSVLGGRAA